ncbi:MAG: SPOR domain-containing protein, partial [Flavobacteriales bacterium]|nr:SPOR domain-containing protein [Flavobacteriales bacterium]
IYSVMQPLYGVQVGAFSDLVPIREEFDNLKNVEAFMDREGILRYVIGHFSTKSQATSLLKVIKETGYQDAFIVDVNEQKRFSNEVIIVDNLSFKTHITGDIEFRVQIGAFKDSIPSELAKIYLTVDNIDEVQDNGLTLLQVGHWELYNDALYKRSKLKDLGIPGPFIVAYDKRQKLSVRAAQKHQERKKLEEAQKQSEREKEEQGKTRKKKDIKDSKQKQFE